MGLQYLDGDVEKVEEYYQNDEELPEQYAAVPWVEYRYVVQNPLNVALAVIYLFEGIDVLRVEVIRHVALIEHHVIVKGYIEYLEFSYTGHLHCKTNMECLSYSFDMELFIFFLAY